MGIQLIGVSGDVAETGARNFNSGASQHVQVKPIPYGALGHYRVTHRAIQTTAQAANSRLFEFRNTHASNLMVVTRLQIKLAQVAAGTAQAAGLDIFRATSFTAVDTTNTVTPTAVPKRSTMSATPGGAAVRGVTAAGASAGMTGGTLTKDATPFWQTSYGLATAILSTNAGFWGPYDVYDDVNGTHPFVFLPNEGFEIENRTLNATSNGVELTVDMTWAEVTAY